MSLQKRFKLLKRAPRIPRIGALAPRVRRSLRGPQEKWLMNMHHMSICEYIWRFRFLQGHKSRNPQQLEQQGSEPAMKPVRPLREALFALHQEAGQQFAEACSSATYATRGSGGCRPIPCKFECPLTLDLMRNPVTAEGDGQTCERMGDSKNLSWSHNCIETVYPINHLVYSSMVLNPAPTFASILAKVYL